MARTTPDAELIKLFIENDLGEVHAKQVASQFGLGTAKSFSNFFEPESAGVSFRAQLFDKVVEWQEHAWILSALRTTWKACVQVTDRRSSGGTVLAAELDEPVPQEKHGDLARAFKEKHKFRPPSNWLLTERTLGRFWRALTSRRMENLDIQIMATADEISVIISSPVKAKIGPFEVTHHAGGKTSQKSSAWRSIHLCNGCMV